MTPPRHLTALIEPEIGTSIIIWLGWLMIVMGGFKIVFYLIGELFPNVWSKIKSAKIKKMLTGKGNRLIFGAGGLITALIGVIAIVLAVFIRRLYGIG